MKLGGGNLGPPSMDRGVQVRHLIPPPPPVRGGYPPLFFVLAALAGSRLERDWAFHVYQGLFLHWEERG